MLPTSGCYLLKAGPVGSGCSGLAKLSFEHLLGWRFGDSSTFPVAVVVLFNHPFAGLFFSLSSGYFLSWSLFLSSCPVAGTWAASVCG